MARTGLVTALAAATLLLSACGAATKPAPLTAMAPDAPADLCASVPATARSGLESSSDTDTNGEPTAACSLRSAPGAKPDVQGVVTWLLLDDEDQADEVLASQCRAIDTAVYKVQAGFSAKGAEKTCAGSGKLGQADSATLAAVSGRTVVTVRWSATPAAQAHALTESTQVLEGVLRSVTGSGADS
jgi:hypothetical protein